MGVKIAGLSPHPPLIVPGVGGDRLNEVQKTINSLRELSKEIVSSNVDLIITISPHGPVFRDAVAVIDLPILKGDFSEFGAPQASYEIESNLKFIEELEKEANSHQIKLVKLGRENLNNYGLKDELDHGVLVPLHYLKEAKLDVPLIAISMGLLDYNTLYKFGSLIDEVLKKMNINGAVLASGDLSHRLKPGAPAGYNPKAENFDKKLISILEEEKYEKLLNIDKNLIDKAGECGLRPLIIALGALENYKVSSDLKSYEGPFGVGYAVCSFNID